MTDEVPEDVRMVAPLSEARLDEIEHNWHNMPGDTRTRVVFDLLADVRASHANERHLRTCLTNREHTLIRKAYHLEETGNALDNANALIKVLRTHIEELEHAHT